MTSEGSKTRIALSTRLKQWWLQPMPPERLAAVRIGIGFYILWYLIPRREMFQNVFRTDPKLFDPVGLVWWLEGPLPPVFLDVLFGITILAALFVMAGFRTRVASPVLGLSLLLLLSYRNSWSMILHMHNGLVVQAMVLGFVRCADVWSVDAWLLTRRHPNRAPPGPDWRYGWPIMLLGAGVLSAYFLSGVAKLSGPEGLAWASGESLRVQVAVNAIRYEVLMLGSAPLFKVLYGNLWLFWFLGLSTLVLELGAPFALAHRRFGKAWALLTWGMHWGIFFVMGIKFRYQMSGLAFLAFFDTEKLKTLSTWIPSAWKSRRSSAQTPGETSAAHLT